MLQFLLAIHLNSQIKFPKCFLYKTKLNYQRAQAINAFHLLFIRQTLLYPYETCRPVLKTLVFWYVWWNAVKQTFVFWYVWSNAVKKHKFFVISNYKITATFKSATMHPDTNYPRYQRPMVPLNTNIRDQTCFGSHYHFVEASI